MSSTLGNLICIIISVNTKNVRIVVMNNLLPSQMEIHHKFDLKGSTLNRKASKKERKKMSPTFKDLDFLEMYPDGLYLQSELHDKLLNTIERDCRVLQSLEIMDYSLLLGIHDTKRAVEDDREQELEEEEEEDEEYDSGGSGVALTPPESPGGLRL